MGPGAMRRAWGWARHDRPCRIRLHGRALFPEVLAPRRWRQAGHETCVLTRTVQRAGRGCDTPHGLVPGGVGRHATRWARPENAWVSSCPRSFPSGRHRSRPHHARPDARAQVERVETIRALPTAPIRPKAPRRRRRSRSTSGVAVPLHCRNRGIRLEQEVSATYLCLLCPLPVF